MDAVAVDPLGRKHRQIHSAGGAHDSHIEAASRDGLSILSGADASRQNVLQGTSGSSVPARRGTWGLLVPELALHPEALARSADAPRLGAGSSRPGSWQCTRFRLLRFHQRFPAIVPSRKELDVKSTNAGETPCDETARHGRWLPGATGNHRQWAAQLRRTLRASGRRAMAMEREPRSGAASTIRQTEGARCL